MGRLTLQKAPGPAGKPTWSKKLPAPCAYCVAFTPDGKSVVTGHDLLPGRNNANCYVTAVGAP